MKWLGKACLLVTAAVCPGAACFAQDSLDAIDKDISQIQQEHQEASTRNTASFLSTLETASSSPEEAVKLYRQSGGSMPEAAPVESRYTEETPTEKQARNAVDQAVLAEFSGALQLHCGMMRLASLFVTSPNAPTLHADWLAWLKSAAQTYPQIAAPIIDSRQGGAPADRKDRRFRGDAKAKTPRLGEDPDAESRDPSDSSPDPATKTDASKQIRDLTMQQSGIGSYLGFNQWGETEQGKWNVSAIPKLYQRDVLEPLRVNPTAAVLPAWDTYIAMMNADETDPDKWAQQDYPPLEFARDSDDFASGPSAEKLQTLVDLIKAHPGNPRLDEWIARVHDMLKKLRAQRPGAAPVSPPPSDSFPPIQPDSLVVPHVSVSPASNGGG